MAAKLSMAEMLSIYKGKDKPAAMLTAASVLPGKNVLEKLEKLYSTRLGSLTPVIAEHSAERSSGGQRTIAICLVIVDELHHEDIWRKWIEDDEGEEEEGRNGGERGEEQQNKRSRIDSNGSAPSSSSYPSSSSSSSSSSSYPSTSSSPPSNLSESDQRPTPRPPKYSAHLFIHAKYPDRIKSKWVRERTLDHSFLPEWNSPDVVRAMLAVLTEAMKDKDCGRFVFGTETCVPIWRLQEAGARLFESDTSWLKARHKGESLWETGACFLPVDPFVIPPKAVWKAIPGWVMLNRRHAQEVLLLPICLGGVDLVEAWGKRKGSWTEDSGSVYAPEEVYFPTMLAILGYLRDETAMKTGMNVEVERRMVTHAQWARRGEANPTELSMSANLVDSIRSSGAVFARKFIPSSCSVGQWEICVPHPRGHSRELSREQSGEHDNGHSKEHYKENYKEHSDRHSEHSPNRYGDHSSNRGKEYSTSHSDAEHSSRYAGHYKRREEYSYHREDHPDRYKDHSNQSSKRKERSSYR